MSRLIHALTLVPPLLSLVSGAFACGVGTPVDVKTAPVRCWTGFYVGANAGGHWGKDSVTTAASVPNFGPVGAANWDALAAGSIRPSGFIGGLQAGYNWQVNNFVLGLESDANFLTGGSSRHVLYPGPDPEAGDTFTTTAKSTFLATLRPRLGIAFDRALFYGTGGVAMGTLKTTDTATIFSGTVLERTRDLSTRPGWAAGGGVEYAFANNWSAKAEYLYVGLRSFHTEIPCVVACFSHPDIVVRHNYRDNIVRAGINYAFR